MPVAFAPDGDPVSLLLAEDMEDDWRPDLDHQALDLNDFPILTEERRSTFGDCSTLIMRLEGAELAPELLKGRGIGEGGMGQGNTSFSPGS